MGCDIHVYREQFVDGKWVSADKWIQSPAYEDEPPSMEIPYMERAYTGRNYQLFGLLSNGVRTEHPFSIDPRGIPFDVSEPVRKEIKRWGQDGHSHSYLYLHELKSLRAALDSQSIKIQGMKDAEELEELKKSIAAGNPDWNKLFPYCGWASSPTFVEFEIDVPASFYVGQDLDTIISSFDLIAGDNHRLVFFFDN